MKDTHFCFAFIHDPGALHRARRRSWCRRISSGVKVRPAQSTIGEMVKLFGGTNVQASAPESRDALERGVADEITFPWGSLILFGIDKVVKYHMDAPLYTTVFTYTINQDIYDALSRCAEEGDRRPLHDRMGGEDRRLPGPISSPTAGTRCGPMPGHEVYHSSPPEQTRRSGQTPSTPLRASWAAAVTSGAGGRSPTRSLTPRRCDTAIRRWT